MKANSSQYGEVGDEEDCGVLVNRFSAMYKK
jgi:hypothetical protein